MSVLLIGDRAAPTLSRAKALSGTQAFRIFLPG